MYLSLYRKWRPQTFNDVIAQSHITTTLNNEIKNDKISHAYLFTGPRGTGKTTCAKIFAKAVNCNSKTGQIPCLKCSICLGADNDSIMDIVELDGASNNSVNDVRTLIEEASFNPAICKYRVYIIDEVHMLSQSAFNALLKIMEEPPSHVIFILATTEVNKIPLTIISRCQRFDFRRIKSEDIQKRIEFIAKSENIKLSSDACELIARVSDGAMRDALSLLEQSSALGDTVNYNLVCEIAGVIDIDYISKIHESIVSSNPQSIIETVNKLYSGSLDINTIFEQLILFYRNIMVIKSAPNSDDLLIGSPSMTKLVKSVADDLSLTRVIGILNSLQNSLNNLKSSFNQRLDLELCLVKLSTPKDDASSNIIRKPSQEKVKPDNDIKPTHKLKENKNLKNKQEDVIIKSGDEESGNKKTNYIEFEQWGNIIEALKEDKQSIMLSGFLNDCEAFICDDALKIVLNNPIIEKKVIEKKDILNNIIKEVTGKNYNISFGKEKECDNSSILYQVLAKAEDSGIEILEEN